MTKPVTSVAFMMLVEEGKVALDDPVHRWIPAWRDLGRLPLAAAAPAPSSPGRPRRRCASIDLLRHTSGLTYGFQQRTNVDAAYRARQDRRLRGQRRLQGFVDALAGCRSSSRRARPGTTRSRPTSIGYLVGVISGMPFDEFLRKRILQPLGHGRHRLPRAPRPRSRRFADCYVTAPAGRPRAGTDLRDYRDLRRPPSGGGGLVSTAADYLRFCEMLRAGGELDGARLLGPKTLALMRANHLPGGSDLAELSMSMFSEAIYQGVGFGLGFAVTTDPVATGLAGSPGEYWWGGMASTAFWIDPVEDVSVVFLTQLMPSSTYPIRRELRTLVNAAIVESKA